MTKAALTFIGLAILLAAYSVTRSLVMASHGNCVAKGTEVDC